MAGPSLISFVLTQPTATQPSKLVVRAALGDSTGPLTIDIPGVTSGVEAMDAVVGLPEYDYTRIGVPPGGYGCFVYDASPDKLPGFGFDFIVNAPPSLVYGCTDPDADNYDPAATADNGSCSYTPHLVAADLPELAPLGVPLWASVSATPINGNVPTYAAVLIDLSQLVGRAGVAVLVDGNRFVSGPLIAPNRYTDAASLLVALQGLPTLTAAYALSQPMPDQVLVQARTFGLPGAPTVSTTQPGVVTLTATAGVPELYSQRRPQWGCYVEVWAGCGSLYGGAVDKKTATLAQRLVLPYREDNAYQVDVAPALRGFTGHAYPLGDGTCPDRLVSYFLRFGEEFADTATGLRRVRSTYETPVVWGLEAMEVPAAVGNVRLLSSRPQPWRLVPGRRAVAAALTSAPTLDSIAQYRLATSRTTTRDQLRAGAAQQVRTLAATWALTVAGALSGELRAAPAGVAEVVLARFEVQAQGVGVTFVNREGGGDTVYFLGNNEEGDKRTAATFTGSGGPATLSAEFQAGTKLYSGLLDFATWHWLRTQLSTTPAVWLETDTGPVRVLLADVATEADTQKGEYSLAVTLNPPPVRGLSS